MICTILRQASIKCTRSDRTLSPGILRFAQLCSKCSSSACARIAMFPWEYVDLHHHASSAVQLHTLGSHSFLGNTSICPTSHQVHIQCARSDRTLSVGIRRSAPLHHEYASSVHVRIALFPWEYCTLHNFAPSAHQGVRIEAFTGGNCDPGVST